MLSDAIAYSHAPLRDTAADYRRAAPGGHEVTNRSLAVSLVLLLNACWSGAGCVMPPPHVNSLYTGVGNPSPRPDSAAVEVFLDTAPPQRQFTVIGSVEVTTQNDERTLENMLTYARAEARKLGGDALVRVRTSTTSLPGSGGYSYPVKNLYTGEVIGVNTVGQDPTNQRALLADIVIWR